MVEPQCIKIFRENKNSLVEGYIQPIKNDEIKKYISIMSECPIWDNDDPFAVTAFGDVLALDAEGYVVLYRLVDGMKNVICADADLFFSLLANKEYLNDCFSLDDFMYAKNNLGDLDSDECYIYEPIPALGGNKSRNTIKIGKISEYITILSSFM